MIVIPSIALCGLLAMLSLVGAMILTKPWMRYVAIGCAALEIGMVLVLVVAVT